MSIVATLASTAIVRNDGEQQATGALTGFSFVQQDVSEGDPPQELKFRESPAKKPRLKALLVHTAPAANPAQPLAFHLRTAHTAPTPRTEAPRAEFAPGVRHDDPVLRLHPGQAPPAVV